MAGDTVQPLCDWLIQKFRDRAEQLGQGERFLHQRAGTGRRRQFVLLRTRRNDDNRQQWVERRNAFKNVPPAFNGNIQIQ